MEALTPEQYRLSLGNPSTGPGSLDPTITSSAITPTTPIQVATPTTPTTPDTSGTSATIQANKINLAPIASQVPDWLTTLLKSNESSSSVGDLYQKTYGITPEQVRGQQQTAQENLTSSQANVQAAEEKYKALEAQIQGLDYQANTVIPNQAQQDATGRGITAAGLTPITAAQQRAITLQKAPLQYQALLAQSDLASAQGRMNLAKGILDQANNHLNGLFEAQKTDITNAVAHQNQNFDKIYSYLTETEKEKVATMKAQTAANQTQANNFIDDVQSAVKDAAASGNSGLAGSIAKLATISLDPASKTFATDYAKANADLVSYKGQITPKLKTGATKTYTYGGKVYSYTVDANGTPISAPTEVGGNTSKGGIAKGSLSDKAFINKVLSAAGVSYANAVAKVPSGKIGVVDNATGQVGTIDSMKEFDSSKYTLL